MNPTITILLLATGATFALLAYREQSRALRAEHERDILRRLYLESLTTLAGQQAETDAREAELAHLRSVRKVYVAAILAQPAPHIWRN